MQVTIYDDLHMGDYIGVIVQYVNKPSEHNQGGVIYSSMKQVLDTSVVCFSLAKGIIMQSKPGPTKLVTKHTAHDLQSLIWM